MGITPRLVVCSAQRRRHAMCHVARLGWWGAERAGRRRDLASGVDKLSDAAKPVVIAVVGRTVAQQLALHE